MALADRLKCVFWALMSSSILAANPHVLLSDIELSKHNVLSLKLSGPTPFRVLQLEDPYRLVVDLQKAHAAFMPSRLRHPWILGVHPGSSGGKDFFRLVVDLRRPVDYTIRRESRPTGALLQLHLRPRVIPSSRPIRTSISPPPTSLKRERPPTPSFLPPSKLFSPSTLPGRPVVIVLDPGHGGHDVGARGPRGSLEKDVVLAIAKHLRSQLSNIPGVHVYLTRDRDRYIDLRQRLRLARRQKADLFVAIHADAFHYPEARGASVYALSPSGASSEAARWLAEKENISELSHIAWNSMNDEVRSVLLDLSQTATIRSSVAMGQHVLRALSGVGALHHRDVEQARFVVLKSLDIPSILIETGFISNPSEETKLSESTHQRRLAEAIVKGLLAHLQAEPIEGTRFSKKSSLNRL